MSPRNRTYSSKNCGWNDPQRNLGGNCLITPQNQQNSPADVPRSLLNTDGLAEGIKGLTISDIEEEYEYGDYVWLSESQQDQNPFTEDFSSEMPYGNGLPPKRPSNKYLYEATAHTLPNRNVVSNKRIDPGKIVITRPKPLYKDEGSLCEQDGDGTRIAQLTIQDTPLGFQTPKRAETPVEPSTDVRNPRIADNLTSICLQSTTELSATDILHSQNSEIAKLPTIQIDNITTMANDVVFVKSEETTMAHSVFGTGSWIANGVEESPNFEVKAFAALPFSDADTRPEIENAEGSRFLSDPMIRMCVGGSERSGTSNNYGLSLSHPGFGQTSQSASNGNNEHQERPSDSGSGSGGDGYPDHPMGTGRDEVSLPPKRLACPYAKHEPQFYRTNPSSGKKFMNCTAGKGFQDISKLKGHLNRVHSFRNPCPRCHMEFEDKAGLTKHLKEIEINQCFNSPRPPQKGIMTPEVAAKLNERCSYGGSVVDKWNGIYQLLLPNQPLPKSGPYHKLLDETPKSQIFEYFARICDEQLPIFLEMEMENISSAFQTDDMARNVLARFLPVLTNDFGAWVKEHAANYYNGPVADSSAIYPHTPSRVSFTGSTYSNHPFGRCDVLGCSDCGSMSSPSFPGSSSSGFPQETPPSAESPPTYVNPAQIMYSSTTNSPGEYTFHQPKY